MSAQRAAAAALALLVLGALTCALKETTDFEAVGGLAEIRTDDLQALPTDAGAAERALGKARQALAAQKPSKPYIVIDTHANTIYLRTESKVILRAVCSTGSGGELADSASGRRWVFDTPRGVFKIQNKLADPWWRKPDWAYLEEGDPLPKFESERYDPNMMGEYALDFGDGYFIHGTIYERLLGVAVTHGCVRVGKDELAELYRLTPLGTRVFVF